MSETAVIAILLSVISILLGVIAFFLSRLIGKLDGLFMDVHQMRQAFLLFRQRVCLELGWPVEDDEDALSPQPQSNL